MTNPKILQRLDIFISSPSDVRQERQIALRAIERLNQMPHIAERFVLKPLAYEQMTPAKIGESPQEVVNEYMPRAGETDIFVCMLWHRLGTPVLDPRTGRIYQSGTEYEFLEAYESYLKRGQPHILLYRGLKPLPYELDPEQFEKVKTFFRQFEGPDARMTGLYRSYQNDEEFETILFQDLNTIISRHFSSGTTELVATDNQILRLGDVTVKTPDTSLVIRLPEIRLRLREVFQYVAAHQNSDGTWLRQDLFPTARTLFGLLTSGTETNQAVIQRSVTWLIANLTSKSEKPDAVAMTLIALQEASRAGFTVNLEPITETLLHTQHKDGYWDGRYPIPRYQAISTAYCIQALRGYESENNAYAEAVYRGVRFLQRYFHMLNFEALDYSDVVNVVEPLMLPHYEAWGIIEMIREIELATAHLKHARNKYKDRGNTKAVAGILSLLQTQWRDFEETIILELLTWLLDVRNTDHGWSEHVGEPSEPHQSVMIAVPIRQIERLGDEYVPLDIADAWSLNLGEDINRTHSVGAVIFRRIAGQHEVALLKRPDNTWVLPKGHLENQETIRETVLREIYEETGLHDNVLKVDSEIGRFRYLFRPNQDAEEKTVTYFLVECTTSSFQLTPDNAHTEVRWFPIDEIPFLPIYYDDARRAIEQAISRFR